MYQADGDAIFRRWPVVVLVDGNTSGAPEWLAAAIQDNKRGTVVGAPTASARIEPGQAIVTSAFRVATSDWSVSLTTGILERGNGKPLSSFDRSIFPLMREPKSKTLGVHPDHLIPQTARNSLALPGRRLMPRERVATTPDAAELKAVEILRRLLDIV